MGQGYSMRARAKGEADILIYEDVGASWFGGVTAKQFAADLRALGTVSTINLRVNSNGGDVFEGLAMYRNLADHPARVVAYVDGIAASIASVIVMAADEIHIAEAGEIMIHEAWGIAIGPAADLRATADRLEAVSASLADVYTARTGQTKDQVQAWMAAETTFQAEAAVKHGFAQHIMPNVRAAARIRAPLHWRRAAAQAPAQPIAPRPLYQGARDRLLRHQAQATLRSPTVLRP